MKRVLLASSALCGLAGVAGAQEVRWTGNGLDSEWENAANWNPAQVPGYDDTAIIGAGDASFPALNFGPGAASVPEASQIIVGPSGAGGRIDVTLTAQSGDGVWSSLGNDRVVVGQDGGAGVMNIYLPTQQEDMYAVLFLTTTGDENSRVSVGHGAGSTGVVNIFQAGKNPGLLTFPGTGVFTSRLTVGGEGGDGEINVDGAFVAAAYGVPGVDGYAVAVGDGPGSRGVVNVLSGGKVASGVGVSLADPFLPPVPATTVIGADGGDGTVRVTDGSGVSFAGGLVAGAGAGSAGRLNILSGGKGLSYSLLLGSDVPRETVVGYDGGSGEITISGQGSRLLVGGVSAPYAVEPDERADGSTGDLHVGRGGDGLVVVSDGGSLEVGQVSVDFDFSQPGMASASVTPSGMIFIADGVGASGAVVIGARAGETPAAPGVIKAAGVAFGAGDGRVVFSHTDTGLDFDLRLSGEGAIEVYAGETWINVDNRLPFTRTKRVFDRDTFSFDDEADGPYPGFSGQARLFGGALGLGHDGAIGAASVEALGDSALLYGAGVRIVNEVAVAEGVTLGLGVAAGASATQAGAVSGAGAIEKRGAGALTLTGPNGLTGEARIAEGVLALAGDGALASAARVVASAGFDISATAAGAAIRSLAGGPSAWSPLATSALRSPRRPTVSTAKSAARAASASPAASRPSEAPTATPATR